MKLIKAKDYNDMSEKAARLIAAQVLLKPASILGLATGSSPEGAYQRLAELCAAGELDFSLVTTINLDEYCGLEPSHPQSYRRFMEEKLFTKININAANTHLPSGLAPNMDAECTRYDALICSRGGIDMQLLGIGGNGHIGFNEPGDAFIPETHVVELDSGTIDANSRFFANRDEVPKRAVTMGMKAIMNAKRVLLVVNTPEKAAILKEAVEGPVTPRVPASLLQLHPDVTVVANIG